MPPPAARARRWAARHPLWIDALLAAVVFGTMVVGSVAVGHQAGHEVLDIRDVLPHTVCLALLASAALVFRRRFPVAVLAVTTVASVADVLATAALPATPDRSPVVSVAVVVALFTVAHRAGRAATWRIGLLVIAVGTGVAMGFGPHPWYAAENFGTLAWYAAAAAAGDAVRGHRAVLAGIRERADHAEKTREEEARRRVAEERMRIARELHDVVAHHIAMVNVQAGVASHVMENRPDQAREALTHVREASRQALEELQSTVVLLRQQGDPVAPTEPASGLARLDELVEGCGRAGMRVAVERPGPMAPLPAAVDLAAYRVVQEALTNVQKHAGPGARATVRLERVPGPRSGSALLEITVRDDGAPSPTAAARTGGGHGLTGMRERAEALGGAFAAGPAPSGGFLVRVGLPLARPGESRSEQAPRGCPEPSLSFACPSPGRLLRGRRA
ncbi:sensor histidine kinase [Streptomyces bohaiensis]|nr:sensor histidine kinase [Streptomyces bohaiensis]